MILLIIDTAGEKAQVRLYQDNQVKGQSSWPAEGAVGAKIISAIDELLEEQGWSVADIDRVAVHRGPGARSAVLRAGVAVASVISLAKDIELVGVDGSDWEEMIRQAINSPAVPAVKIEYRGRGYGVNSNGEK